MATAEIGALRGTLSIDGGGWNKGLADAERRLDAFDRGVSASIGKIGSSMKASLAGLAAGVTLGAVVSGFKSAVDEASKLVDVADRLRITTEDLQKLAFAADQNGSSFDTMTGALTKFSIGIGEAQNGTGDLGKILEANNIALRDAQGNVRPLVELFSDYLDLIRRSADGTQAATLSMTGFGKGAAELGTLARVGAEGLKAAMNQAESFGAVVGDKAVRRLESLGDQMSAFGAATKAGFIRTMGEAVLAADRFFDRLAHPDVKSRALETIQSDLEAATARVAALQAQIAARDPEADKFPIGRQGLKGFQTQLDAALAKVAELKAEMSTTARIMETGGGGIGIFTGPPEKPPVIPPKPDGNGGTGRDAAAEALTARVAALRETLLTEQESEQNSYAQRMTDLADFYAGKSSLDAEYTETAAKVYDAHRKKMVELDQQTAARRLAIATGIADGIGDALGSLSQVVGAESKRQFEISKTLAYASAVVSTASGIAKTIGTYGWTPLGIAGVAAAAAAGAAQIAAISRQQFTASGGASASGGGASAAPAPAAAAPAAATEQTIYLKGYNPTSLYTGNQLEGFVDALNQHFLDSGKRIVLAPA